MGFFVLKSQFPLFLYIAIVNLSPSLAFKLSSSFHSNLEFNSANLEKQVSNRIKKLEEISKYGDPYPVFDLSNFLFTAKQFNLNFKLNEECNYYGRVSSIRHDGLFIDLTDDYNEKVQIKILLNKNIKIYETEIIAKKIIDLIDLGDILAVKGIFINTSTGEPSIEAKKISFLSKCITIPPDKKGLVNIEKRLRHRHLDLRYNIDSRNVLLKTWRIKQIIRDILTQDYKLLEVETPILQPVPSGANATPFETQHKTLDMKCFLRISPELYLKRLLSAGVSDVGVFEFARCFRNEGITFQHSPEFNLLEIYIKCVDLSFIIKLFEDIINKLYKELNNSGPLSWETLEFIKTDPLEIKKPTHLLHLPNSETPLAKKYNETTSLSFESYLNGIEICHGAVEECNPIELLKNIRTNIDRDFIDAANHGLIPMSGLGIGIDRLSMILCDQDNIKSTQAFSLLGNPQN